MDGTANTFPKDQLGSLPDLLGFEWTSTSPGAVQGRFEIRKHHLAPNGYLHAATVVALADTACGYGCWASLPDGASGFTTAELKTNFIGTGRRDVQCASDTCRPYDAGLGCRSGR
jgi:1,4-dihydroxy-2-naphthoyl-CoA hydrolase